MNDTPTPEPETQMRITDWLREHPRRQYHDAANYIDSLERERDSLEDQRDFARNMIRVLERERDEAREKLERQADRIRYLEGATNHATGTPLTVALRERDEAREQRTKAVEKYQASIKEMHEVGMQRDGLAEALRKIANEDYRGNAPQSVFIARAALATINKAEL